MISVIIPTYNNERFIASCLDSVLAQHGVEKEIIVVDDGSTDGTPAIVDDYAARHACITAVHVPHAGQSAARNVALRMFHGEWLVMVDSDDIVPDNALRAMLDAADNNPGVDIVAGRWYTGFYDFDGLHDSGSHSHAHIISGKEAAEIMLYQNRYRDAVHTSPCCKLYRSRLWRDEAFREGSVYEDLLLIPQIFAKAGRVAVIDNIVYCYRCNPDSTLHTFSPRRFDALRVAKELTERFADDPQLAPAACSRLFSAAFNLWLLINANGGDSADMLRECRAIVRRLAPGQIFGRKVRFKNRVGAVIQYFPFILNSGFFCKKLLAK
ncbi:MAG: glycosyltransferase [Muribaculaceae bacterium]|nr:glycosyltransferase [Muribaculaceae bacterium]